MSCPSCGRAHRPGARFCGGCGASLASRCAACGTTHEPDARFCDACGAALRAAGTGAAPGAAGDAVARKVVTIVFADLIGSTALHERLDPESVSRVMEAYHAAVRVPIEAHGGTVVQLLGDGVMCAFGVPQVAEDDALRAVRAAVDVQRQFRAFLAAHAELAGRVGLRVAVNTGEVVVSDDYAAGIGDPLNVAARLQQEARDGDVLIGGATQRFVADQVTLAPVGHFALKGRSEPVAAYRVVSLERPARAAAAAFVGREAELSRLRAVYDSAVAARTAKLAVVLGSPGLGKSRLVSELARGLAGRASVLVAQCPASGGATFAPLAEPLRAALDTAVIGDEAERARIAAGVAAILAGKPASPEETFFVVRRLLAALAASQPVVLAIDDLHWAEPLLLDLVEHLVQWGAGTPLLVLAAARPELREVRSSLAAAGGPAADVVTLGGLDAGAATRLAASVIGAEALPAAIAGRVLATSEGNPLFLAELVRMLVNDGVLRRDGDAWVTTVGLADLEMPPTIQALLAARIERLRPDERLVLERAAVVGRQFSRAAVAHLLPPEAQAGLDAKLEALRRSELIEPDADGGWFLGEPALRFHHVLIRDAAYRRPLRNTRAELHARFAEWLAERAGGDTTAHDETIGWHLEQSFQHRRELGLVDASTRALGARAARHLADAGRRALARDDLPPAAGLLGRALDCLEADDPARAELALDWCEALLSAGAVGPAAQALAELGRFAATSERLRAWHACFAGQLAVLSDPQALRASAESVAGAAAALAAAGDAAGEAKAHSVEALALAQLGKIGACEAALDRALAAARRAGDRRRANAVLAGAPVAALWGPSPVTRASGRCLDVVRVLRITQGAPAVEAVALRCQAVLETLRGRGEAARRMIASSRRMVEELGITQRVLEADVFAGLIELLEGDGAAAERLLRPAYAGLRAQGLGIDAAQAAALLGRALLAQGRADEAETASRESEALAGDSFKAAIAWRCVRAETLAARGEPEAAVEAARAAVEIAAATDDLLDHADARHALAVALRAAGRMAEADAEEQRAAGLWEEKGATLPAGRARHGLGQGPAERAGEAPAAAAPAGRRAPGNAATALLPRFAAAARARDMEAIAALCADELRVIHHPTGATIERAGGLARWRLLFESEGLDLRYETIATLGNSLALTRDFTSFERAARDELAPGASRSSYLNVGEANERGQATRIEVFAEDRLGDAVVRLYERYAERLPEGPERRRAEATARSLAVLLTASFTAESIGRTVAPGIAATDVSFHLDAVLATRPDALLARWTNRGSESVGGGPFERHFLSLNVFDREGRLARWEHFDPEREAEALGRFEALAAERSALPRRGVRANTATACADGLNAAILAHDARALPTLHAQAVQIFHHATGVSLNLGETLDWWAQFFRDEAAAFRLEPIASLGASLALFRQSWSGLATGGGLLDLGDFERAALSLIEADSRGAALRIEIFAPDHVGEAVARLYERHAELLPAGPVRERAESVARSLARALSPVEPDTLAAFASEHVELVDHRSAGLPVTRGLAALRSAVEAAREIADDLVDHYQDVLAAEPDALLMRWTTTGRGRAGGGDFEWPHLRLCRFGADGCLDRIEAFGTDQELEALARFDALAGAVAPATRLENAAARAQADFERAWRERRWDDAVASFTPAVDLDDRRALVGVRARGEEFFRNLRLLFETPSSAWRSELLATRGERHALFRARFSADAGGAPIEDEHLSVVERDAGGRARCIVVFDADQLDAAWAELDSCYEAAEGAGDFAWSEVHAWHVAFERRDFEALARILSPDFQLQDHRLLGLGTLGAARYVELMRSLVELAPDVRHRIDHFVSAARGALAVSRMHGARDGGPFELTRVSVRELDASGRLRRIDHYDPGQLDLAFARLAELREPEPIELRLPNAATRSMDRYSRAWQRRDWDGVAAEFAPAFRFLDRQRFAQLEQDREGLLDSLRRVFELEEGRLSPGREADGSVLATWGERLALARTGFVIRHRDVGTSELANLSLVEVDGSGRRTAMVAFDADASDAARAELERRFYAGEAAEHPNVAATMQSFVAAFAARDWDALGALFAEDVAVHDHRRLGWEPLRGRRAYVAAMRSLVELSPDVRLRLDDVRLSARGVLWVARWAGTHEGGPYDTPWISVSEHDAAGVVRRLDQYDLDQLEAARARFEALRTGSPASAPNRVLRALERFTERFVARDWTAVRALAADGFVFEDRRRRALVRGGVEMWIENFAFVASWADRHTRIEPIAAHGDRIALQRVVFSGEHRDSRFEGDFLRLVEVDAEGRLVAWLHFDPEDRAAALAEAHARAGAVSYRVERARAEDVPKLARVELAANTLFTGTAHGALVAGDVTAPEELAHAAGAGLLWVARAPDGEPVGFALVEILDGRPHLEELDVDPAHGRRGLGRALLGAVLDWARGAGHAAVTLTTFRDVPWNAPFYERMGFRALAPDEIGPGLAATMREEAARGLDPATRVAMRLELDR